MHKSSRSCVRFAAALGALVLPLGIAVAIGAESASTPAKPQAATKPAEAPKEDPKAWKIAPDWKLDVLLEKPAIHHPSVVFPAPDGRIFLAEDPMDMKGSSKDPADRILVIHPDGKITVFAEGLYAVFGMQYIDGKLYVHHTPKFSVFTDKDSVGVDRVDLLDCTNPSPNNDGHGFNDHIPSNCRLAMDGYLYITTGDKGIYGAQSKVDHSKAEIHGGGILRMRPDGSQVEAYSTGTRNHLDVAINAEDEMFTYDNTDDGLGWWCRFTHMVDGGYYGYPYDYRPPENDKEAMPAWDAQHKAADKAHQEWNQANKGKAEGQKSPEPPSAFPTPYRPWTLWRMEEYGGGSPTGSVAYNEEALPAEYHGNVFASEWGKGNVERFVVERAGATYKVTKREIILSKGPEPLRPVGIQVLPDGSGILVADWNYAGWRNANADAGRLLKLTYTGKLTPSPRPTWWVAAAQGQPFQATTAELIAALSHPAESVRLVAQRRIADRGEEAVPALLALLKDAKAPNHAKWHAIWTLDRIDNGKSAPKIVEAIAALVNDKSQDVSVRMQAVRQLGTRKVKAAVPALVRAMNESDEALRFRSATALGRIGDVAAIKPLIEKLSDKDLFAHYAVFHALNRIAAANPQAWEPIVAALGSDRTETREGAALAMHETYDEALVKLLAGFAAAKGKPADARAMAVGALAPLQKQPKPWEPTTQELKWWGTMPARNAAPPKEVEWAGMPLVTAAIRAALDDGSDVVRHAAIQALRYAPDPTVSERLATLFESDKDLATRKAILAALASAKAPQTARLVERILATAKADDPLFEAALDAAERTGAAEMAPVLVKFVSRTDVTPEQVAPALRALAKLPDVKSIPVLIQRLQDPKAAVFTAASEALGAINDDKAVAAIVPLLKDKRPDVKRAAANALGGIHRPSCTDPLLAVWQDKDVQKEAILALTARADLKALDAYLEGLSLPDGNVRGKCKKAIESIHEKALPVIEARLDTNPPAARVVAELQQTYEKFVPQEKRKEQKLYQFDTKALAPEAFAAYAKGHDGDAGRGKKIFMDENGVGCVKCHKVAGKGGDVGPVLDGVGTKYPRDFLVESILYPSKQILDGYQQTQVKRKSDGDIVVGIARGETDAELTLIDSGGQKIVIPKSDVASRKLLNISLMPEGLQTALKPEEFADVVAFLESLKEAGKK
jgi:putative membrane-bound dehydrogenase-like protein